MTQVTGEEPPVLLPFPGVTWASQLSRLCPATVTVAVVTLETFDIAYPHFAIPGQSNN